MGVITADEFLAHYGVMGMKWGVRKDDGLPTRAETRAINKEYRAKTVTKARSAYNAGLSESLKVAKKKYKAEMASIRKAAQAGIKDAKKTYKVEKRTLGELHAEDNRQLKLRELKAKREYGEFHATQAYNKLKDKSAATITRAYEHKTGKEAVMRILPNLVATGAGAAIGLPAAGSFVGDLASIGVATTQVRKG